MAWELLGTLIVFVLFLGLLVYHERQSHKRNQQRHEEVQKHQAIGAECANKLHKKKYGRPSTELENEFPSLKIVR